MDMARRVMDGAGLTLAAAGSVLVGWWLVAVLADSAGLPEYARLGPMLGLLLIAAGAVLRLRLAPSLIAALAALGISAFLLVVSSNPLRGLTPAPGEPASRPEALSLVTGLAFAAAAVALVIAAPRSGGEGRAGSARSRANR
jgi:hypothetical protein